MRAERKPAICESYKGTQGKRLLQQQFPAGQFPTAGICPTRLVVSLCSVKALVSQCLELAMRD